MHVILALGLYIFFEIVTFWGAIVTLKNNSYLPTVSQIKAYFKVMLYCCGV